MATAKTPKKIPAAAPAAVVPKLSAGVRAATNAAPAARAVKAKAKPAPARAAAAKAPEDAVVHSAEIVGKAAEKTGVETVKVVEKATEGAAKVADAAVVKPAQKAPEAVKAAETVVTKLPEKISAEVSKAADTVTEIAAKPSKAVAVIKKAAAETEVNVMRGVVPFLDYSRDNAILLVAAGNEFALGLHKLSLSLIDWSAESCDKGVAAGQAMLSAKSVEEVIDLSQTLAKDGFEQLLKEGSELSALSSKLIEDTIVPLPGRLAAAVEKLAAHAA
jgi:phasin family protein